MSSGEDSPMEEEDSENQLEDESQPKVEKSVNIWVASQYKGHLNVFPKSN